MSNKTIIIVSTLFIGTAAGLLILFKQGTADQTARPVNLPAATLTTSPVTTNANRPVREITVNGSNFKFSPGEITVKQGDWIRLTFKNDNGMHDWQLPDFNADTQVLKSGEQQTIDFMAGQPGEFEYFCSVGNHRQMGMQGVLVVE